MKGRHALIEDQRKNANSAFNTCTITPVSGQYTWTEWEWLTELSPRFVPWKTNKNAVSTDQYVNYCQLKDPYLRLIYECKQVSWSREG